MTSIITFCSGCFLIIKKTVRFYAAVLPFSYIDHRRRQQVVRTSMIHSAITSCATFLFRLTRHVAVDYYWTDARQIEIYLLNLQKHNTLFYSPYSAATCRTVRPRSSLENTVTANGSWRFLQIKQFRLTHANKFTFAVLHYLPDLNNHCFFPVYCTLLAL